MSSATYYLHHHLTRRRRIIPNIPRTSFSEALWCSFLTRLYNIREEVAPDVATVSAVVSKHVNATVCTTCAVSGVSPFAIREVEGADEKGIQKLLEGITLHLQLCLSTNNQDALSMLLKRVEAALATAAFEHPATVTRLCSIPWAIKLKEIAAGSSAAMLTVSNSIIIQNAVASVSKLTPADLDAASVFDLVQLCRATGNLPACQDFLTHMTAELSQLDFARKADQVKNWYIPLLIRAAGESDAGDSWDALYNAAAGVFYDIIVPELPTSPHTTWCNVVLLMLGRRQEPVLKDKMCVKINSSSDLSMTPPQLETLDRLGRCAGGCTNDALWRPSDQQGSGTTMDKLRVQRHAIPDCLEARQFDSFPLLSGRNSELGY